jgi:predicted ABC-type ATPase
MTLADANARAWRLGRLFLQRAIDQRADFALETTLGGRTMTGLLMRAANVGMRVQAWYVGLDTPERHVARVSARVARGGHGIPEARIRERYDASRANLVALLPYLSELKLWDNSVEGDPHSGGRPSPELILHFAAGRILAACAPGHVPEWAKPIVRAAIGVVGR